MDLELRYRDEGVAIGTCGCVVLFAWRGDATLERVAAGETIIRAHAAKCPRAIAILNLVEEGAGPPHGEPQRRIGATLADLRAQVAGAAVILEGSSRWLAIMLDVLTAVRVAVAQKHTVCRDEAALWIVRRCKAAGALDTPSRQELRDTLAMLQRAVLAGGASRSA